MKELYLILIGFGFGAFGGCITTVAMLKDLIRPDVKIGKIKARNSDQDVDLDIEIDEKRKKRWFSRKKS